MARVLSSDSLRTSRAGESTFRGGAYHVDHVIATVKRLVPSVGIDEVGVGSDFLFLGILGKHRHGGSYGWLDDPEVFLGILIRELSGFDVRVGFVLWVFKGVLSVCVRDVLGGLGSCLLFRQTLFLGRCRGGILSFFVEGSVRVVIVIGDVVAIGGGVGSRLLHGDHFISWWR